MSAPTVTRLRSRGARSGRNHKFRNSTSVVYCASPGDVEPINCSTWATRAASAASSSGRSSGDAAGSWLATSPRRAKTSFAMATAAVALPQPG